MLKLILTTDGSHTIYNTDLNENYHSVNGAVNESRHVFIKTGLHEISRSFEEINILEVGMGTGLNVFLSVIESLKGDLKINYTAIEPFPVNEDMLKQLNYPAHLNEEMNRFLFEAIHSSGWNNPVKLSPEFMLSKINSTIEKIDLIGQFNLIYFDAFAPQFQPELWTPEIFKKIFDNTMKGGMLVTYCAKGQVKRNLKQVGFTVESLQGPPGKREMVRAVKEN